MTIGPNRKQETGGPASAAASASELPTISKQAPYALLADEINQFAIAVERLSYTQATSISVHDGNGERERWKELNRAARRLRERISELIPE